MHPIRQSSPRPEQPPPPTATTAAARSRCRRARRAPRRRHARLRAVRAADRRQPEALVSVVSRRLRRPRRRPRGDRLRPALPASRPSRAAAELHGGRGGDGRRRGRVRRPSDRELARPGPIAETHDLLQATPLSIARETVLRIRHCLLGVESVPLEQIRVVRSHPAALDQCRRLLAAMPWATAIAAGTTAEAAAEVAERGDPEEAAIAGERAAGALRPARSSRATSATIPRRTRASSRSRPTRGSTGADEDWRTAFSFVTDHRPGALAPRDRAVRPPRDRPRPARLAADPGHAVALLLPRRPRRPPARRADPGRAGRGARADPSPEGVRLVPRRGHDER